MQKNDHEKGSSSVSNNAGFGMVCAGQFFWLVHILEWGQLALSNDVRGVKIPVIRIQPSFMSWFAVIGG
ncbi:MULTISPECIES: hypothetical protein [Ralstonia solanacearum species complex]|nr:hypothetical protein [Ralstonia solanacearum]